MAKGTISIANGTAAITGEGTTFTAELAAGDYIVFTAGQVVYTLAIKSVDSDTALTLSKSYTGPDAAGLAWSAVPRSTMSQITMEVVNQVTEALRGLNHDKENWQQVFSESNDITVTLPDGSEFTGPSWSSIANLLEELDPDWLHQMVDDVTAAQASVNADRTAAEAARDDAQAAANSAAAAQQSAEEAGASATQSASDAATSASAAADSATSASESAAESLKQAERAQSLADKFDAEKILTKDANLSDVTDRAASLQNLMDGKPLPLAAEAVGDFDAVTLRQLKASSGGGGGANMNGVMNNFIGAVEWFNGSRASLPAGYVAADGQLINRSDAPDLWAAVSSGFLTATQTDAIWMTSSNAAAPAMNRGMYSPGDGSKTFRVPDLNGIQPGSVRSPFLRGAASGDVIGRILQDSAPSLTGILGMRSMYGTSGTDPVNMWVAGGASDSSIFQNFGVVPGTGIGKYAAPPMSANATITNKVTSNLMFDASRSSSSYGRDGSGEVHPSEAFGIWIIRASGAFQAANTSFSVINSYASYPSSGTVVDGGRVQSEIRVAGSTSVTASLVAKAIVGGVARSAIEVTDYRSSPAVTQTITIPGGGGTMMKWGDYGIGSPTAIIPSGSPSNANNANWNGFYTGPGAGGVNFANEYMPMLVMSRDEGSNVSQIQVTASGSLSARARLNGTWTAWRETWNASNTTVDANGFIKRASPVVKIFTNGSFETNDESFGATVSRIDEGVYLIEGCLGLNSDGAWSGPDGGFEIPVDRNKQPLIWLDYSVGADGSITVKTYHRVNGSSPKFAQNLVEGKSDGDPIDIPSGVFVSVRVQMPEVE
ncbi:pyocin knob domain-containing protein [Cronobacter dublinensis]